MKIKISLFAGFVLLICSIVITGCSKKGSGNEKLKIGVILSLSGNGSGSGDYTLKGIQLAVKEQNAKGGLLGKQIELDIQDSKGNAETGLDLINTMLGQNVKPFMVCSNTSDVSLSVKTETEKNGIILVASAATDKLLENSNYIVRNYIESGQISDDILAYVQGTLHLNSIGVFYADNEFGKSVNSKMAEKAGTYNVQLPFDVKYDNSLEYGSLITAENINAAPAIYVIGLGKSLGVFIKQLREAGYTGIIIGDPLFNNPDTKTAAGEAATGVKFLDFAFDETSAADNVKAYVAAYTAEFKSAPQNLSAITYDALKILFTGIEQAKSLDYKKIAKYTEDKKYIGVTGEIWIKDGNITYPTVFKTQ